MSCGAVYDQVCPSAALSTFGVSVGRAPGAQGSAYATGEGREDAFLHTRDDGKIDWKVAASGTGQSAAVSAAPDSEATASITSAVTADPGDAVPPSSSSEQQLMAPDRQGAGQPAPGAPVPAPRPLLAETMLTVPSLVPTADTTPVPAPGAPTPPPRPADTQAADGSAVPIVPMPVPPTGLNEPLPGVSLPGGSPLVTSSISPAPPIPAEPAEPATKPTEPRAKEKERVDQLDRRGGRARSLSEVIARAVASSPEIGAAGASAAQAKAGIGIAQASLYPTLDSTLSTGHGTFGNYTQSKVQDYWDKKYASGSWRSDGYLSGRQLLYDWGATDKDIERAEALARSQNLKTRAVIEDVAFRSADAYLQIQQQRDLVKLAHENVASMRELARLVELNQNNGNGTLADVKRVRARVLDAETQLADAEADLLNGIDRFRRLTRSEPGELKPMPTFRRQIPATKEQALMQALRQSPRILSLSAASDAARAEVVSTRATGLPKIQLEASVSTKELRSRNNSTEVDARGVLSLRYNLMDGGLLANQVEQALQRQVESDMKQQSERDSVEADLRQYYRTLSTAQGKASSIAASAEANGKAREVYGQQFQGGKRTLLELLEVQTAYFTSRRALILNAYEERRAANGVLLAVGRFAETALAARN